MQYSIEVDEQLNNILTYNAQKRKMSVSELISEMLKQYAIDSHIMEQSELWKSGAESVAEVNLDWANL